MTAFNLPDLGEGLQEAEVVAWHVADGDHVVTDQPLLSVETEKAVVEIPSPQSGRIARLLVRPGERVAVGAPVLYFEEGLHPDSGTVVGDLPKAKTPTRTTEAAPESQTAPAATAHVRASPAVRARARELGVDLAAVIPSGPGGTVSMSDLEASAAPTAPEAQAMRGARRTMASNMARAWREVAHATLHDAADIQLWRPNEDVTVRLIRAIVAACTAEPALNGAFISTGPTIRHNERIDIGLAIDSPDGLFVPVLRDAGRGDTASWRQQIDAFKDGVKNRKLTPSDFRAPTITLSNFGTIAGTHAALIVMPPQVAILGAGRIADRPVRQQDAFVFHRSLPLSLTFDHRAVSGGEAARFLRATITDLEQPE
jgi:pyruvate dehydrogenase E2 component (dihydrolipoamide acetyltransferase)